MNFAMYSEIFTKIEPHLIVKSSSCPDLISNKQRFAMTLEYLANSVHQKHLCCNYRVSKQVFRKILDEVCTAIINGLREEAIPQLNSQKWLEIAKEFDLKWNFPHCLGAIDGKRIAIKCPPNSGSLFYYYKGYFSIVLMAIANAKYRFIFYDIGAFGSEGDSSVFRETKFSKLLHSNNNLLCLPSWKQLWGHTLPFMFVADDAFPLTIHIMKPYKPLGGFLSLEEKIFNYRLSRARHVVENAFGILAVRWGCLSKQLVLKPDRAKLVVEACCVLHNYLMSKDSPGDYCPPKFVYYYDSGENFIPGAWRNNATATELLQTLEFTRHGRSGASAKQFRENLKNYFNSDDGSLPWQLSAVNET